MLFEYTIWVNYLDAFYFAYGIFGLLFGYTFKLTLAVEQSVAFFADNCSIRFYYAEALTIILLAIIIEKPWLC